MKPHPTLPPEENNAPKKVALRIGVIVGGFVLLIIVIGWIYVATHR
jgi:hypothetical protein